MLSHVSQFRQNLEAFLSKVTPLLCLNYSKASRPSQESPEASTLVSWVTGLPFDLSTPCAPLPPRWSAGTPSVSSLIPSQGLPAAARGLGCSLPSSPTVTSWTFAEALTCHIPQKAPPQAPEHHGACFKAGAPSLWDLTPDDLSWGW